MKKLFSILCAFAIVFSASAAPAKRAGLAKFAKEHAKEVKAQKSLKAEKAASFATATVQKAPAKQQFTAKHEVRKAENATFTKAPLSAKAQAAKVAKAKKEATDVTIGSWDVQDWGEDGELYLYAKDNTVAFYFDLYYGEGAEDLIPGKEYTVADVYVSESTGEDAWLYIEDDAYPVSSDPRDAALYDTLPENPDEDVVSGRCIHFPL